MIDGFKEWACSLSGCDGGNHDAEIWICGIEWGGNNLNTYYNKDLKQEVSNGKYFPQAYNFDWKTHLGYTYGRSFGKICTAMNGYAISEYKEYLIKYSPKVFKFNLYPIAFNNTNLELWNKDLEDITGFKDKQSYLIWCKTNRFAAISSFINKDEEYFSTQPRVILCTGISYAADFFQFFASGNLTNHIFSSSITYGNEKRDFYYSYLQSKNNDNLGLF